MTMKPYGRINKCWGVLRAVISMVHVHHQLLALDLLSQNRALHKGRVLDVGLHVPLCRLDGGFVSTQSACCGVGLIFLLPMCISLALFAADANR